MKLTHLEKTINTMIDYYTRRDRPTRVEQLKEWKERVNNNHLENEIKTNGLYLGQSKEV